MSLLSLSKLLSRCTAWWLIAVCAPSWQTGVMRSWCGTLRRRREKTWAQGEWWRRARRRRRRSSPTWATWSRTPTRHAPGWRRRSSTSMSLPVSLPVAIQLLTHFREPVFFFCGVEPKWGIYCDYFTWKLVWSVLLILCFLLQDDSAKDRRCDE